MSLIPSHRCLCAGVLALAICTVVCAANRAQRTKTPAKPTLEDLLTASGLQYFQVGQDEVERRALLVGCSSYASLPAHLQLEGPGNDVILMRKLLLERFRFSVENIVTLSENSDGTENRPTRAHIVRELERLAQIAKLGDQLVILLAGHGSQQPDQVPPDPDDPEPDGLDEIFLPADIGPWDSEKTTVTNAIVDDELRAWLRRIRDKGASLWVIVDACHSGTMIRGNDQEITREVAPEVLVSADELQKARQRVAQLGERARGAAAEQSPLELGNSSGLVAIYAAQASEPTVEKKFPPDDAEAKYHGLLTYTVCQVLNQATRPVTYRELAQRVHGQYVAWGRNYPTPLVEGGGQDREILGEAQNPEPSRILLTREGRRRLKITAGALHGLTTGSILAVYPPAGQAEADKPLGHVRIKQLLPLEARVEPCEYAGISGRANLPLGAQCRTAYVDYGALRLRVALDGAGARERLRQPLREVAQTKDSLIEIVDEARTAHWIVRIEKSKAEDEQEKVVLVPSSGLPATGSTAQAPLFGVDPTEPGVIDRLKDSLSRIARARNLLALATASLQERFRGGGGLEVKVELLQFRDRTDVEGEVVKWQEHGFNLHDGDIIGFRIHNPNPEPIDVSLLFVDSGYGIQPIFPRPGTITDNRLPPGSKPLQTPRSLVRSDTVGLEHMVVIAVKGVGPPVDFGWLAQPSIERTRGTVPDSPLARLFENGLFAEGNTRGLGNTDSRDHAMAVISWHTLATPRESAAE